MVVLAASICTRGGKAVLSRQFREMQRSRIEALLAGFPKLADSGTQHTTVEQDNVRFVYQPLDELYMVLITNRQSNILQDIDSLHLFAQVVTSICKSLDEREILRNAFELLSAFDELVTLGYRENLTISQIKTFLEMESSEEKVQEIIARNKELEASEERKRKAKQLEMQRKEMARNQRGSVPRAPNYPTYTAPIQSTPTTTYDSYNAQKNQSFSKPLVTRGKGMQLGKKSKTTNMFDQVKEDLGPEAELSAPLITTSTASAVQHTQPEHHPSGESISINIVETVSARLGREGSLESLDVKGDLQLRVSDSTSAQIKIHLALGDIKGAQLNSHPKVDKTVFKNDKIIQLTDTTKSFPINQSIGVMRWKLSAKAGEISDAPITFTAWVNEGSQGSFNVNLEYDVPHAVDTLSNVAMHIPFPSSEPSVTSTDASYDMHENTMIWNIGDVSADNATGSFEFEVSADNEGEFFPMEITFSKSRPYVDVDISSIVMTSTDEEVTFAKDIKCTAENYIVE